MQSGHAIRPNHVPKARRAARTPGPRGAHGHLDQVAAGAACATLAVCGGVLIAWIATHGRAPAAFQFLFEMKVNTALGFGLIAAALLTMRERRGVATFAATGAAFLGGLTLLEYAGVFLVPIDTLLVPDASGTSASYPGRMSPNSATVLLALGAVLPICLQTLSTMRHRIAVKFVCFAAIAIGMQALIGHMLQASFALGWGADAIMSLPTMSATILCGAGLMARCWALEAEPFARMPIWVPALLAFSVLFFDMNTTNEVNAAIAYIPLVFCTLWFARPNVAFVMAGVSTLLIALGYFGAARGAANETVALVNCGLAVMGVWAVAALVYRTRKSEMSLQASHDKIAEQNAALEFYSHALTHDLREPVRTITAYAAWSERDEDVSLQTKKQLAFVREAAERMGRLIDSVTEFARIRARRETPKQLCDMAVIAEDVRANLSDLIARHDARVTIRTMPFVQADEVQMMQLLQNLVANAIVHSQPGVAIDVTARREKDSWLFAVTDDGPGIPAAQAETIFEPFKRLGTGPQSSGLGLAIARRIVEGHGGRIWVETECMKGTAITFVLPVMRSDVRKLAISELARLGTKREIPTELPTPKRRADGLARVLIVDDMPSDLELSAALLREGDGVRCHLMSAQSVETGLALLRTQAAIGEPIDLVLLDIYMPGRDGYEMLDEMRADPALADIPVVMCSGSQVEIDQKGALTHGAAGFVSKPPSLAKIAPVIGSVPTLLIEKREDGAIELLAAADSAAKLAVPAGATRH